MTELDLRRRVCDQARSWKGRNEYDGSHRDIIDTYNRIRPLPRGYRMTYSDPWCAAFVSAVGKVCNLTDILYPECACDPMIALYKAAGRWEESDTYIPQPGDVIFYDWQDSGSGDNTGSSDHVGLVVAVDGSRITIIEGNCADSVCYQYRQVDGRYIRGYGLPDYAAAASAINSHEDPEDEPPAVVVIGEEPVGADALGSPTESSPDTITLPALPAGWHYVPLPDLQIGDGGPDSPLEEPVRAAQYLLRGRGFSVGWMGADGDFGTKTERAVGQYQADRALERDGIIGPLTWRKLICD